MGPLPQQVLPEAVRSRFVENVNGLRMHVLEAGFEVPGRRLVLLLHGFPEIAYSWRRIMPALAAAGFHVVAPDQRGYGRTTGAVADYDTALAPFSLLGIGADTLALVRALGHEQVAAVVGHDFGAPVAAWCALTRPDVFRAVCVMSAPFGGPPGFPPDMAPPDIHAALAALERPRKHYQWYYATRPANRDMWHCQQGVHDFLRAYFHVKSADWPGNQPSPLQSWSAGELAKMPTYYVMDRDRTMAETVAPEMPSRAAVQACRWLTEEELAVYSEEYRRTGFQGGLNWYRCRTGGGFDAPLRLFSGRAIAVPALFIAGRQDWGVQQAPGALDRMRDRACRDLRAVHLVGGAGHWVQQEQPAAVAEHLLEFLGNLI